MKNIRKSNSMKYYKHRVSTIHNRLRYRHKGDDLKSISPDEYNIRDYIDPYCYPMPFENMLLDEVIPMSKYTMSHRVRYINKWKYYGYT